MRSSVVTPEPSVGRISGTEYGCSDRRAIHLRCGMRWIEGDEVTIISITTQRTHPNVMIARVELDHLAHVAPQHVHVSQHDGVARLVACDQLQRNPQRPQQQHRVCYSPHSLPAPLCQRPARDVPALRAAISLPHSPPAAFLSSHLYQCSIF